MTFLRSAFRASTPLRAAKSAEPTNYHLAPKGFWKKFRDAVVVSPDISSGLPLQAVNRQPPPGSRPERYSTPATKASDPAQNPYWKRDARRSYPRLSVVDQTHLAQLLLASPELPASTKETAISTSDGKVDLAQAITTVAEAGISTFSTTNLPPKPPTKVKWQPAQSPDAPHDPKAYFPMALYS